MAKRITLKTLRSMYAKREPISMVTAYDYPSAVHVSLHTKVAVMAGTEVCLQKTVLLRAHGLLPALQDEYHLSLPTLRSLQQARQ